MQDWRDPMMAELKLPGVTKDGAWYKQAQKPQLMYVPRKDYGLKKLFKRLKKDKKVL